MKGCETCFWRDERDGKPWCRCMKERGQEVMDRDQGQTCGMWIEKKGERGTP